MLIGVDQTATALIVDIVRSRELTDRRAAQAAIEDAFRRAHEHTPVVVPLWPTVGDEFQAVYADVASALRATTLVRLLLPEDVDCRFGLGTGDVRDVGPGPTGPIQDGSAWWHARAAVEEAHRRESGPNPYVRSWSISEDPAADAVRNAYLLLRDRTTTDMRPRERRLTAGVLLGRSQAELGSTEGITQSAVSQSLRRSGGAALLAGYQALGEVTAS